MQGKRQVVAERHVRTGFGPPRSLRLHGRIFDAKPGAGGLYDGLGFMKFNVTSGDLGDRPDPIPMFLSVKGIARAVETCPCS